MISAGSSSQQQMFVIYGEGLEPFCQVCCLCIIICSANIDEALRQLRDDCLVRVLKDKNDVYTHICFVRFQQITWFRNFHHVVNVDATHGTNREGYVKKYFYCLDINCTNS